LRAKVRWHEEGERSTKYFFGLEKQNYRKKTMNKIKIHNNTIYDKEIIQKEQYKFYKQLYSSSLNDNDDISNMFFNSASMKQLDETESLMCNIPITKSELKDTLLTFKTGKTPGNDGLPCEFYKMFWDDIIDPLFECYETAIELGELSSSQKQAVVTLIEKTGKDRAYIKNWRPISLLNFDYKLLSKSISIRIQNFLPSLIHKNQTGFIKGRYIGDSIRVLQDIMLYTVAKNIGGLLLFVDFEKAFDSIEWRFLWKTLNAYNFGDYIIKIIKVLYCKPESCIMNQGLSTHYFDLQRGVRQGDPLSPYLFILALELLAVNIRDRFDIKGIRIGSEEIKLTQYADDMTLIMQDKQSAQKAITVLQEFKKDTGLKINLEKCEGMWLGIDRFNDDKPFDIKWPLKPIRVLGVYLSYNKDEALQVNFEDKIASLLKQLHWWKARKLSLTGKVLIVKALALSKFTLLASLVQIPNHYITKVNSIIFNFIWNGKCDKVKRKIFIQNYQLGGMKMVDFKQVIAGAQLQWLTRYLNLEQNDWKMFFDYFLNVEDPSLFIRSNFALQDLPAIMPDHYRECLVQWQKLRMTQTDELIDFIWYNKDIRINKKVVYCKNMFASGLWVIPDLFDDDSNVIPFETWRARGVHISNYLLWRGLVQIALKLEKTWYSERYRRINKGFIELDCYCISIDQVSQKEVKEAIRYKEYMNIIQTGYSSMNKYETLHGRIDINRWMDIYMLPRICDVSNHIKDLQYKIVHRFLPTQSLLYKMKKINSPLCLYCMMYEDNLEHALYECFVVKNFWFEVFNVWNNITEELIDVNLYNVTFGFFNSENEDDKRILLNTLLLFGKQYIFQQKLNHCFLSLNNFKEFLRFHIMYEEEHSLLSFINAP